MPAESGRNLIPDDTMEVKEFAEQVLFGTTLEDKLIDGGRYHRGHPASPIATPA